MQYSDWSQQERDNFKAWAKQFLPLLAPSSKMLMSAKALVEMYDLQFASKIDALDAGAMIPNGALDPDSDRLTDLAGAEAISKEDVQKLRTEFISLFAEYLDADSQDRTKRCVGINAIFES